MHSRGATANANNALTIWLLDGSSFVDFDTSPLAVDAEAEYARDGHSHRGDQFTQYTICVDSQSGVLDCDPHV